MNETLTLLLAGLAGGLLGMVFFGGLWWTVRRAVSSPRPAVWFLGSLLLRISIVLGGFYFVGHGNWERIVACLFGFFIARFIVMRFSRTTVETNNPQPKEASHAS
jgi:F1F0 ATPase subunit 2